MKPRAVYLGGLLAILVLIAGYGVAQFICLLGRPALGIERSSASLEDSKANGFYVGSFTPNKRQVTLRDLSSVAIPDAWAEHSWKPGFSLLFRDTKQIAPGYNFFIPIPHKRGAAFVFSIELSQADRKLTGDPVMCYSVPPGGWEANFDTLPDNLTFVVKQKRQEHGPWTDTVPIDTIQFSRVP